MKGRKPDLKVIEGESETPALDVPAHIPAEMAEEWRTVSIDLVERKLMNEAMRGGLDAYIMALWNMRQAQEQIDKHGLLIDAGKGILKQNPAVSLLGKAQQVVLRLSVEMGLTPASRSRAAFQPSKEKEDDNIFSHAGLDL
ncbi:phage terminase small subunit P27 family [Phyllobacterium salinisoli]|uniref:Phage terminase small subunit P27 family n=1 Tax=Phyllobacterium salinisoli TaxID=1899321 RepID=A0A368K902_9HYPH|nr:phage terminase small subunit P27 family [Phyllobacterium salinisoli]RCS25836.1 phage terminase small subunit P27 family [Phyllobacterium salinisoli]